MSEFENLGVEEQEVTDLAEDIGEEEQELAEPDVESEENEERDLERDAAFATMRREKEELARELAELKQTQEARAKAIAELTGDENAIEKALAEAYEVDEDALSSEVNSRMEQMSIRRENEELKTKLQDIEAERAMQEDLIKIQKIDPNVKDLEKDLDPMFSRLIANGNDAIDAYWACKAKEQATKMKPPEAMGDLGKDVAEKDYFTFEEVNAMTPEQQAENAEKILASATHWK